MKKKKLLFLSLFCCLFIALGLSTKVYAFDGDLPVSKIKNKELFKILRTTTPYSKSESNYRFNTVSYRIPTYVYNQHNVELKVGEVYFAGVGCELAACYNASEMLDDPVAVRERKKINRLPNYIKIAEQNKYLMALNKSQVSSAAYSLLKSYSTSVIERLGLALAKGVLSIPFPRNRLAPIDILNTVLSYYTTSFSKVGSFGTDPYAIPDILKKGGLCKAEYTYDQFYRMNLAVNNSKANKFKTVYIVSYWNYDTLLECLNHGSGFHTVCFYTENGKIYSFNNKPEYSAYDLKVYEEQNLSKLIEKEDRFIVGYQIVLQ